MNTDHIRESFFKWANEYGVDKVSHEEWNKFLSIWNLRDAAISGTLAAQAAGHQLYTVVDRDRPDSICDRNGDVVLSMCRICGKAESQLVEPCRIKPGPYQPVPQ